MTSTIPYQGETRNMAIMKAIGDSRKPATFSGKASDPPDFIQALLGRCWQSSPHLRDTMPKCVEALSERLLAMSPSSNAEFMPSDISRLPKRSHSDGGLFLAIARALQAPKTPAEPSAHPRSDTRGTETDATAESEAPRSPEEKTSEANDEDLIPVSTSYPDLISKPSSPPQKSDQPHITLGPAPSAPPPAPLRSRFRRRPDASALPLRLPSLPVLSGVNSGSNELPRLPHNVSQTCSASSDLPTTSQPPETFQGSTAKTSLMGPTSPSLDAASPRQLTNASTPGTYIMSSSGGAVTFKMTPSLVLRPLLAPIPPPMRFPSLLVSGISGGEQERSRTESEVGSIDSGYSVVVLTVTNAGR